MELRERVVRAYETGDAGYTAVAHRFGVHRATVIRWVQRARTTGSVAAHRKRGGWTSPVDVDLLERLIRERPDMTTNELTRAYNREAASPRRVHRSSVLRALHRRAFVFKKNDRDRWNRIVRRSGPSAARSSGGREG